MNEITESEVVNGDQEDQDSSEVPPQSYAMGVTEYLRKKAFEWYSWNIALEVVSDGYTLYLVYPADAEILGKHKMYAAVLRAHLRSCAFDPQKFAQLI